MGLANSHDNHWSSILSGFGQLIIIRTVYELMRTSYCCKDNSFHLQTTAVHMWSLGNVTYLPAQCSWDHQKTWPAVRRLIANLLKKYTKNISVQANIWQHIWTHCKYAPYNWHYYYYYCLRSNMWNSRTHQKLQTFENLCGIAAYCWLTERSPLWPHSGKTAWM